MDTSGLLIVLAAGTLGSATLLPMKFVKNWPWENTWLIFALFAYLIFPLAVALITIPGLTQLYREAGWGTILLVSLFGLGWGLSLILLGLSVAAVGLAVTNGIILGCSIAIGSLVPLLMIDASSLFTPAGVRILLADGLILAGVAVCARAGYLRDRGEAHEVHLGKAALWGVFLCFIAGLLTPLFNLAFSFGSELIELARQNGAKEEFAVNGVWGLACSIGSLPSIVYCATLLRKNSTWTTYRFPGSGWNVALCVLMGALFIIATVGYGMGALRMGPLGPVIGWPVYISSLIIGNCFWGWLTGEWQNAPTKLIGLMIVGIFLQVAGIVVLSLA
ncbi:L-rhamnose/proton symporter RhaT [Bythopirellula goksoeyrii]|uniref:L-rhamnose-proton symporter n=1 Tax=Bythopirellula goksoeyrii TaxID=1400387 RepID=A0A5B9Q7Y8_9BACT|nr:L-rhamnose/proton symporter RhaT [Bythopirellula goksoeyrii]QEG35154.1 L-rhamnose-proton symporter [Bythopirellula goksoeyrii]